MADYVFPVPPEWDNATMQSFLRQHCGLSWRMVVKLKRVEGGMTADGVPLRSIDRLRAGQTVRVQMPEDAVRIEGADMPLSVVYEDEHLLVIDKPPYLAVHPSAGKPEPTLANAVVGYFERKGTPLSFRPVNRLDRNTSGLLLAAKSPHVAYALAQKPQKEYLAVVLGALTGSGTVDQPIRVKEGCCITREVGEGGKPSVTHWESLGTDGEISLVRLALETGRTHQIRVHMAYLGHPLAGDTVYGSVHPPQECRGLEGQCLHAREIGFVHPVTGETLCFSSELPAYFTDFLRKLKSN